ncbi:MAG: hypothetical protein ABEJ95_02850 [Candidatus Nanohalobium sp.]
MKLELDLDPDRKDTGLLITGLLIGIILTAGFSTAVSNSEAASRNLVSFLENQSGQNLEIIKTEEAGKFYQVEVKTADNRLNTYYTNGEIFTANMQNIEQLKKRLTELADFQQCLKRSGTVMFGNTSQQATQKQFQILGGTQIVSPIYRDVSNRSVLTAAVQNGVQRVPAFYRNGSIIQGIQTPEQVEKFTGCKIN